jgi:hypothetical protein
MFLGCTSFPYQIVETGLKEYELRWRCAWHDPIIFKGNPYGSVGAVKLCNYTIAAASDMGSSDLVKTAVYSPCHNATVKLFVCCTMEVGLRGRRLHSIVTCQLLDTGYGLTVGFTEPLWLVITSNYNTAINLYI